MECRSWPVALAGGALPLLAALVLGAGAARAVPPPREHATIVALGYTQPLATHEGLGTPIVVLDHESGGHYGDGTLTVKLLTSLLRTEMRHPVAPALALSYGASVQIISVGDGEDLYERGRRLPDVSFNGYAAGLALSATLFPEAPWQAAWEGERQQHRYGPVDGTVPEFVPPGDFTLTEQRVHLRRLGLLGEDAARLALSATRGQRGDWRAWSLDPDAAEHARYRKEALRWEQPATWSAAQRSELKLAWLGGAHLDLLSGYRVGGFGGREVVAGYYRNEFRARRLLVANAQHEWRFAEDRRLVLLLDAARLDELPLSYRTEPPRTRSIVGAGVGFYYGIRSLYGLPVIVRYGEGLRVPAGSPEGRRRELLLVLAAAF